LKIVTVLGIRPDWIAMSRLIPLLDKKFEHTLIHCQQHYDWELDGQFFKELSIREPDYFLGIKSGTQAYQTGAIIQLAGGIMGKIKPDLMISFSDANPAMAAIAASKQGIKVLHLEAGLRSNDWRMAEEKNRRIIDSIADYYFPPTMEAIDNLLREGVYPRKIVQTSKIVLDAIDSYYTLRTVDPVVSDTEFILVTLHRPENVDNPAILLELTKGITTFRDQEMPNVKIIAPLHPRTLQSLKRNPEARKQVETWEIRSPLGFVDFTWLEEHAQIVFTDSGTVQEDTNWLGTKCVTCRISTERPETIGLNNTVVGRSLTAERVVEYGKISMKLGSWKTPYTLGSSLQVSDWIEVHSKEIQTPKVGWND